MLESAAETNVWSYTGKRGVQFCIRRATAEDVDAVMRVNRLCLPENYTRSFFEDHLNKWGKAFYVSVVGDKVVGYVMCRVEWGWSFFKPGFAKKGHVISIAVLAEYRRQGMGEKLLEHAMESLKSEYHASEVYLEVRVSNRPAISLYEKMGFKVMKVVPMYYLDGEDAYLMAKKLE